MAGIAHLQEFQPEALRGIVDATLQEGEVTFADRYLPNANVFSNTFVYDIIKTKKYIGAMIGYGAEAPIVDRDAVASKSGEIAKMGLKYIATEEELLHLHQARNEGERQNTVEQLVFEGVKLVQAIQRRVDVIKAEVLAKGKFEYAKNGVNITVDFTAENDARLKVVKSGTGLWSDASVDVIGDLLGWVADYEDINGSTPAEILISREVQTALLKNLTLVAEAGRPDGVTRISTSELAEVLNGYGLPPVRVVTDRKATVTNVYTGAEEVIEYFPANRVVMLGEGVGNFLFGPTVENNFAPGVNLSAEDLRAPIRSVIEAVGAGFPAVEQPTLIFHADVL